MKKLLSVLLILATLLGIISVPVTSVSAASTVAYDILSTSRYAKVYTLSTSGKTIPYTSKYLSTRGSVTYGRSSTAYIDNRVDELYLCDVGITNGQYWAYVSYPIGSKRAYAYIQLSAITGNNGTHAKTTSTGKFYCSYRKGYSTSSSYYVAKGDTVYLLATSGSQYQILYPISGGQWRIGWCSKSDYDRYCNPSVAVTSVQLRYSSYALKGKGSTVSLLATVYPSNATNKTLTWTSSNTSVATVNTSGKVTTVGAGTATITATTSNGKKAVATIKVLGVISTRVTLNSSNFTLSGTGSTKTLTATVSPSNSTDKVTWMSSNPAVATVNASGKVTAVKNGTATITATTTSGKRVSVKVTCNNCNNWDSKVGTTIASIKSGSSYTKWYNSSGNISANGGYYGQCTWYAYGRFYEVTGIQLQSAYHAKYWLDKNKTDSRLKVTYGSSGIKSKSIAVRTTGTYGHVMFIEYVTFDSKGNPQYVYFTECNTDGNGKYNVGSDCILQKMTYSTFVATQNPAGYISAK